MKLKEGVSLEKLRPEITRILPIIEGLYNAAGAELTITCTTGSHGPNDPHPNGYAVDTRTHGINPETCYQLARDIMEQCGPEYYSQYEPVIKGKNGAILRGSHIHTQVRKGRWQKLASAANAAIPA